MTKTGSILGKRSQSAYTFRARSHEELMEWWNDVRMLVARYLVASQSMDRSGPLAHAVRHAGYLSEDEEEEEDEGSSIEEEEDDEEDDEARYHAAHATLTSEEAVPAYSQPNKGLEVGSNGYLLDKKPHVQDVGASNGAGPSAGAEGLSRKLSRKQEKAPEGQEPHSPAGFASNEEPSRASVAAPAILSAANTPAPMGGITHTDAAGPAPLENHEGDAGVEATTQQSSGGLISKFKEIIQYE